MILTKFLLINFFAAAFWVTNPNNTIQHNAVAGGTHFGNENINSILIFDYLNFQF